MKLSKNLTLKEVTKSNTANRLGIDNKPEEFDIKNLREIAEEVFQPLRDHFGVPLYISSGFRCKELKLLEVVSTLSINQVKPWISMPMYMAE